MGAKDILKWPLSIRPLSSAKNNYIVTYHDIANPSDPTFSELYSTSPTRLRAHLEFFKKYFELVSLTKILQEEATQRPRLAISFDDGFASVKNTAWPILKEFNAPFTIFVNRVAIETGSLDYGVEYPQLGSHGKNSSWYLSMEDLRQLVAEGVDIESHGASHRILSECSESELLVELKGNANYLRSALDIECKLLSIPFGKKRHYNNKVLAAATVAGHTHLFSTNPSHFLTSANKVKPRISLLDENESQLCFLLNRSLLKKIDL